MSHRPATFKCICHGCDDRVTADALDMRCDFCFAHCPDQPAYLGEFERSFFSLWCFGIHGTKRVLEEDGFDPIETYPRTRVPPPAPVMLTLHTDGVVHGPRIHRGGGRDFVTVDGPHLLYGAIHVELDDVHHAHGDIALAHDVECRRLDRACERAQRSDDGTA
jgi:hypothetical protein